MEIDTSHGNVDEGLCCFSLNKFQNEAELIKYGIEEIFKDKPMDFNNCDRAGCPNDVNSEILSNYVSDQSRFEKSETEAVTTSWGGEGNTVISFPKSQDTTVIFSPESASNTVISFPEGEGNTISLESGGDEIRANLSHSNLTKAKT